MEDFERPPSATWDTVWNGDIASPVLGSGDWAIAGDNEPNNAGGLKATNPLETAMILLLFTREGWHGNALDNEKIGGPLEAFLERAAKNGETLRLAHYYASEQLQPLIDQGAVGRFEIETEFVGEQLHMWIRAYRENDLVGSSEFAFPVS